MRAWTTRRVSALVTLSAAVAVMTWGCSDKPKQAPHQHGQTSATATQTGAGGAAQTGAGGHAGHDHAGHGAGGADETIPKDQSGGALTKDKKFFVSYTPSINPIPFQELFDLEIKVLTAQEPRKPVADAKLDDVRATMPAHKHGMKVKPTIEAAGPGTFRVKGMRFHMRGDGEHGLWALEVVAREGETIDVARFDLQCCRDKAPAGAHEHHHH